VEAAIPRCIETLRSEGLLIHPTETVYGIGGAISERAIHRVNAAKGRGAEKNLLLVIGSLAHLALLGLELDKSASILATLFWPGPLTLVLPVGESGRVAPLRGSSGGVGVRLTAHAGLRQLLTAYGDGMTSTSANRTGMPPALNPRDAAESFAGGSPPVIVLDAGTLRPSAPSTLVDCTGSRLRIVREGALPASTLQRATSDLPWES
jgi:L-threonylcarbamoyladenylate synthase